jgi:hypothetical protein
VLAADGTRLAEMLVGGEKSGLTAFVLPVMEKGERWVDHFGVNQLGADPDVLSGLELVPDAMLRATRPCAIRIDGVGRRTDCAVQRETIDNAG